MAPGDATMKETLRQGMEVYEKRELKRAIPLFERVIRHCGCKAKAVGFTCTCKDTAAAIQENRLKEELQKPCKCPARSQARCQNTYHLMALLNLSSIAEKQLNPRRSLNLAEQALHLSPRSPKVYLRYGRAIRQHSGDQLVFQLFEQGVRLVERKESKDSDSEDLRVLRTKRDALRTKLVKVDVMPRLPAELASMILSYLEFGDYCRCLRVSKSWRKVVLGDGSLWRKLDFKNMRHPWIRAESVIRYIKFSQNRVRSFAIDRCQALGFAPSKLMTYLGRCPDFEELTLRGSLEWTPEMSSAIARPLKRLYLGSGIVIPFPALQKVLNASANSLEALSIFDLRMLGSTLSESDRTWPLLPKLKTFQLATGGRCEEFDLPHAMNQTPNVETVWIDDVRVPGHSEAHLQPWQKVKDVYLGSSLSLPSVVPAGASIPTSYAAYLPHLSTDVEKLSLSGNLEGCLATWSKTWVPPAEPRFDLEFPELPNLKRLSICGSHPVAPLAIEPLAGPSLASGQLGELEICPFPFDKLNIDHEQLSWFASDYVHFLSIRGMAMFRGVAIDDPNESLLRVVSRFPNLRVLDIGNEPISQPTIYRIIEKGVTEVYHQQGFALGDVSRWAESKGARVVSASPPDRPRNHPDRPNQPVTARRGENGRRVYDL